MRGPGGTGMFDTAGSRPKKDLCSVLAGKAKYVLAVGTCASFGGIPGHDQVEGTGLQFDHERRGGFLGSEFKSKSDFPVINISGCPMHPDVLSGILSLLADDLPLELDELQRPLPWYGMIVHQGCTRNEYHEYRVEEKEFGERGCLFFYLGCHGPLTYGPCNKLLWNGHSSKPRTGIPCFGCTSPDFPKQYDFFRTRNIEGIPLNLPEGVQRAHYLVYKGMAAVAAPKRLKMRKTEI
jgi:hydrogenase small subunit